MHVQTLRRAATVALGIALGVGMVTAFDSTAWASFTPTGSTTLNAQWAWTPAPTGSALPLVALLVTLGMLTIGALLLRRRRNNKK